jgi:hypothetical protein
MFSGATLEKNLKKNSPKNLQCDKQKKKTPLVGAAFTLADAGAKAVTPSP